MAQRSVAERVLGVAERIMQTTLLTLAKRWRRVGEDLKWNMGGQSADPAECARLFQYLRQTLGKAEGKAAWALDLTRRWATWKQVARQIADRYADTGVLPSEPCPPKKALCVCGYFLFCHASKKRIV